MTNSAAVKAGVCLWSMNWSACSNIVVPKAGHCVLHLTRFTVRARLDTDVEVDYFRNGGILPYVLRKISR
jgi:aconitase A